MDFLLTALLFLDIFVGFNAQPSGNFNFACGHGEEYHMCKPPCEQTCENIRHGIPMNCSRPCISSCFCKTGLIRRASDNACVLPSECNSYSCQENEEYLECGSPCELNCTNIHTGIFCTKSCHRGCFCKPNFVRNSSGKCVHPRSCIHINQRCPENEIYVNCINMCNSCFTPEYCTTSYCIPGCDCKPGYFRNEYLQCVTKQQCLAEHYDYPRQCGLNEIYSTCVNPCNDCISKGRCEYDFCAPGCDCKQGFFRNGKGICTPELHCYAKCNENEVYLECGPSCRTTCENFRELLYHACKQECIPGCFCKDNFVLGPNNRCVFVGFCPPERQPVCPPGEQLYPCMPTCRHTCETFNDPNTLCDTSCTKGCFCKSGMIRRRKDELCVHPKDCPADPVQCPPGEVLYQCLPTCRLTCRTLNVSSGICSTECKPGCFCQLGFVRNDKGNCVRPENCPGEAKSPSPGFAFRRGVSDEEESRDESATPVVRNSLQKGEINTTDSTLATSKTTEKKLPNVATTQNEAENTTLLANTLSTSPSTQASIGTVSTSATEIATTAAEMKTINIEETTTSSATRTVEAENATLVTTTSGP